jgi:hypothetical protein
MVRYRNTVAGTETAATSRMMAVMVVIKCSRVVYDRYDIDRGDTAGAAAE